jgi:hypothetical protein
MYNCNDVDIAPAGRQHRGMLRVAFCVLLLAGCPDPQGQFDEFTNRQAMLDLSANVDMSLPPSMIYDINGTFLAAVSTMLSPTMPLQFKLDVTMTMQADGTALVNMVVTPLSVGSRNPVGTPVNFTGGVVNRDGTFSFNFGTVMVPGAANPITGSDITVTNFTLQGVIRSQNRFCGNATGKVTSPIMYDLMGAVWGAIRVTGATLPAPDYSCPASEPMDMSVSDQGGDAG